MATSCTGVGSVDVLVLPVEGAVSGAAVAVRDWLLVEGEVGPAHDRSQHQAQAEQKCNLKISFNFVNLDATTLLLLCY